MKFTLLLLLASLSVILQAQDYTVDTVRHNYPSFSKPIQIQPFTLNYEITDYSGSTSGTFSVILHVKRITTIQAGIGTILTEDKKIINDTKIKPLQTRQILSNKNLNATWYVYNKIGKKFINWCVAYSYRPDFQGGSKRECDRVISIPSKAQRSIGLRTGITDKERNAYLRSGLVAHNLNDMSEIVRLDTMYKTSTFTVMKWANYNIGICYRSLVNTNMTVTANPYGKFGIKRRQIITLYFDKLFGSKLIFNDVISEVDQKKWRFSYANNLYKKSGWLFGASLEHPDQGFLAKMEFGGRPDINNLDMFFNFVFGFTIGFKSKSLEAVPEK